MTQKIGRSTAAWLFGLSVTVLFVALWGRAVVVDSDSLGESLAPLAESSTVVDLVTVWATDEFVDAGVDPGVVEPTIDYVLESTSVGTAFDTLISEVVDAAGSSDPSGSSVDMRGLLAPVVPEVTSGLAAAGFPVPETEVQEIVDNLDPLTIREPGAPSIVGPSSPAAARLGSAALLAGLGILVSGYMVLAVSEDRLAALRELLTRVAISGLSFAVLLRLGSWVLDPSGGRAPIPETLSHLTESKWLVPLRVAVVAAVSAVGIYMVRRWLRRGEVSPELAVSPRPQEEQPLSLSGLR